MPTDRPSHVTPDMWEFANSADTNPIVVILKTGFQAACERKVGTSVGFPPTDVTNSSSLVVQIAGKDKHIPWTEIQAIPPERPLARVPGVRQ